MRDGASFALQGFAGDGTSAAAIVGFVQGQNPGSAGASVGAGLRFTSGVCLTP